MFEADDSRKATLDRGFFSTSGRLEASVTAADAMLTRVRSTSFGQELDYSNDSLTKGEIAILRFLTAVELIESDLWQQYDELGGATTARQNDYQLALQFLNRLGSKYITGNAVNEIEHSTFLRTRLESEGIEAVNLDEFRILRGSAAKGSQNVGRLTNLMHLNIDTNCHMRFRSDDKPSLGTNASQDFRIANRPAIPCADSELGDASHVQTIANTAVFHFRFIEQEVSSLYTNLSQRVKRAKVLKITLGIGGQEIAHFLEWTNFAANVVQDLPLRFDHSDTNQGTAFPDSDVTSRRVLFQTNPRFSSRGTSIRKDLPLSSIIRPVNDRFCSAVATIEGFIENGIFFGQSTKLLRTLMALAEEADASVSS
ncbi:MAG TPA: hypothetical protein VK578_02775 [Edaphobacter sp.]|nr:hypothetical protein [Edaphobacter sp.]